MRRQHRGLDAVPQIAGDPIINGLNSEIGTLNLQLSQLKEQFKEGHPEVQKVQARLAEITRVKEARATQVVDGMQSEYSQIQKRETELKSAMEGLKSQAASQSRKGTELETLKKEADSAKNLYDVLLQKMSETDIAASIKSTTSAIVERAVEPRSPVRPDKRKIAMVAFALGLILGVGLVFARDYLANTIRDPEEIERYLRLDLLAAVPRYDEANVHLVTEAYQNLRTALLFGRKDRVGRWCWSPAPHPRKARPRRS